MFEFQQKFIVQDMNSAEFLCPDLISGGITTTPFLKNAGKYDFYEDALEAGVDEIGEEFSIFSFFERIES